ncbi:hypothetical protein os1_42370 [Comamonadaceae bacterium OS-1]|nr:hypothetical protein os1_42370 [Comamonadaceae bacterium OS-1]
MHRTQFRWAALVASLALGGCSTLTTMGPSGSLSTEDRLTVYGANPQFNNEKFEVVDLFALLDPDGLRMQGHADAQQDLERAFAAFYHPHYNLGGTLVERRTRLQDRLIAASNQRCEAYKIYLRRFEAYQDTSFGLATTLLGGAAAVVGGLRDAKILGGLAGISSGSRAELRQGLFGNLASFIIVPGLDQRRKELMAEIQAHRADPTYTVQAAISDVARYHGACTLETGMEQAKNAIQTVSNPGMTMVRQTLNSVMQARLMAQAVQKVGSGTPLTEDDLRIPSFNVDGVNVQSNAYTVSSGSALAAPVPPVDSAVGVTRATANMALQQVLALKTQAKDQQAGLEQEKVATSPVPDKAVLDSALQGLQTANTTLDTMLTALNDTAKTSLTNAATADACLNNAQFKVSSALPDKRAATQMDSDTYRIALGAQLSQWSQTQALTMAGWSQQLSGILAKLELKALRTSGDKDPTKSAVLPTTAPPFKQFVPPATTEVPACKV